MEVLYWCGIVTNKLRIVFFSLTFGLACAVDRWYVHYAQVRATAPYHPTNSLRAYVQPVKAPVSPPVCARNTHSNFGSHRPKLPLAESDLVS